MTTKISDPVLAQLSEFVASHLGLHFPRERWCDLQRAIGSAVKKCGYRHHDMERYVQELWLLVDTRASGSFWPIT